MSEKSKILLADDSRFFLTIEAQFLRNAPVSILEARSGEQALELCRRERPQLVYLAFELPEISGAECCQRIKADPELQGTPVVLVCKEQALAEQEQARAAGCDAILTKPLDRTRFLEIGRSFLAGVREPRRPCLIPVKVAAGDRVFPSKGLDISSGGLFVESGEALDPGTVVGLEIQLCRPGEQGPWIRCRGKIGWLNTKDKPFKPNHPIGFGIKFVDVPKTAAAVLNGFIRSLAG